MTSKRIIILILAILIAVVLPYKRLNGESSPDKFTLTLPSLRVEKTERIVEFNVTILHGLVITAPKIPYGWYVHIDLPLQWKTIVTAGATVGVAELTSEQTNYFRDFLVIEPSDPREYPISVSMEIKTENYTRESGTSKKTYSFSMEDLRLTKLAP